MVEPPRGLPPGATPVGSGVTAPAALDTAGGARDPFEAFVDKSAEELEAARCAAVAQLASPALGLRRKRGNGATSSALGGPGPTPR